MSRRQGGVRPRPIDPEPTLGNAAALRRREFLRFCAILGLSVPAACTRDQQRDETHDQLRDETRDQQRDGPRDQPAAIGSVVIVGAGAAGLIAARLLVDAGVEVVVLEAADTHGGRTRRTLEFVDFPIPLGAEWLHVDPAVLGVIANRSVDVELVGYEPDEPLGYFDGRLTTMPLGETADLKFVGSSWLDFLDEYVVPDVADRLRFGRRVTRIDENRGQVLVTDDSGRIVEADAVIVTVPIAVLRDRDIRFVPDLTDDKWTAIDDVQLWGGIKMFVEFSERFYPTFLAFPDSDTTAGQRLYYDAAHGQDSDAHVLGLFAVGEPARPYQGLDDVERLDRVLAELDEIFDGAATRAYLGHVSHDWNADPFVRQAYVADEADWRLVRTLGEPASERILFAGDAYSDGEDWGSVHVAARSARDAVARLLGAG